MCLSLFLLLFYSEGRIVHDMALPKSGRLKRGKEERDRKGAKHELSLHSARTMPHRTDVSWSTQHPSDNFTELIFPK